MKKILHVLNVPFVLPYYLGDQISFFNDEGYEVHIACTYSPKIDNYLNTWEFKYFNLNVNRRISIIDDITSIVKLYKYIKRNGIALVVGHTPKGAMIAMISSYFARVKTRIYVRHGIMFETSKNVKLLLLIFVEKITSFFSSKVLCVSDSVLEKSIFFNLTKKSKLFLLNKGTCNGIDTDNKFNPLKIDLIRLENLKIKYNINEDDFLVGYIGRLSKDKGIEELVDAWELMEKFECENKNLKLFLCGPDDERDPINLKTTHKILNSKTIYNIGAIDNPELYYSLFSIFILPSYREGFPTVVLEASSMGVPVITTKHTGCIDSIIENVTGIFTKNTSKDIYSSILFYLYNPVLVHTHGIQGRQFVVKNFKNKQIWQNLLKFYIND